MKNTIISILFCFFLIGTSFALVTQKELLQSDIGNTVQAPINASNQCTGTNSMQTLLANGAVTCIAGGGGGGNSANANYANFAGALNVPCTGGNVTTGNQCVNSITNSTTSGTATTAITANALLNHNFNTWTVGGFCTATDAGNMQCTNAGGGGNGTVGGGFTNLLAQVTSNNVVLITSNTNPFTGAGSINAAVNIATSGANGLDTGSVAANTWYNWYIIYGSSGTAGLLSLSATSPTLPSGYTSQSIRLGTVRTSASNALLTTIQYGYDVSYIPGTSSLSTLPLMGSGATGNVTTPTWTAVSVSNFVPPTAVRIRGIAGANAAYIIVAPDNNYGGQLSVTNPPPLAIWQPSDTQADFSFDFALESNNIYWAAQLGSAAYLLAQGWQEMGIIAGTTGGGSGNLSGPTTGTGTVVASNGPSITSPVVTISSGQLITYAGFGPPRQMYKYAASNVSANVVNATWAGLTLADNNGDPSYSINGSLSVNYATGMCNGATAANSTWYTLFAACNSANCSASCFDANATVPTNVGGNYYAPVSYIYITSSAIVGMSQLNYTVTIPNVQQSMGNSASVTAVNVATIVPPAATALVVQMDISGANGTTAVSQIYSINTAAYTAQQGQEIYYAFVAGQTQVNLPLHDILLITPQIFYIRSNGNISAQYIEVDGYKTQ